MAKEPIEDSASEKFSITLSLRPLNELLQCEISSKQDTVQAVKVIRSKLISYYKREQRAGTQSGKSGGHGTPYKKVGSQLIRIANQLPSNIALAVDFKEALKIQGRKDIKKGNSINHPG